MAESQYNQIVKWSGLTDTFEEFISSSGLDELDFDELLDPWAAHFGADNIIARIYDAQQGSIIPEFMSCLLTGPAELSAEQGFSCNRSAGYLAVETFRFLNKFNVSGRRQVNAEIQKALAGVDLPAIFFSAAEALAYRQRFSASNRRFLMKYFDRNHDDLEGRRFSDTERDTLLAARAALCAGRSNA